MKHLLYILLLNSITVRSQNAVLDAGLWNALYADVPLTEKWTVRSDIQYRFPIKNTADYFLLFRPGIGFNFNSTHHSAAGFVYASEYSNGSIAQREIRFWQEYSHNRLSAKIRIQNKIRLEERFAQILNKEENWQNKDLAYRLRYKLEFRIELYKTKSQNVSVLIGNEIMFNYIPQLKNSSFDQNRSFAGLQFNFMPQFGIQLLPMLILNRNSFAPQHQYKTALRFNLIYTV